MSMYLELSSESQRTKYCLITSQLPSKCSVVLMIFCNVHLLLFPFNVPTPWVVGYPAFFFPLETQLGCLNYSFPGTFKAVASQTDYAGAPQYRKGFSRSSVFMSFSSTLAGKILLWSFVGWRQPYLSSVSTGSNFILKTNTLNDMYWCLHVYGPLT